jgi:hypothetical protein
MLDLILHFYSGSGPYNNVLGPNGLASLVAISWPIKDNFQGPSLPMALVMHVARTKSLRLTRFIKYVHSTYIEGKHWAMGPPENVLYGRVRTHRAIRTS